VGRKKCLAFFKALLETTLQISPTSMKPNNIHSVRIYLNLIVCFYDVCFNKFRIFPMHFCLLSVHFPYDIGLELLLLTWELYWQKCCGLRCSFRSEERKRNYPSMIESLNKNRKVHLTRSNFQSKFWKKTGGWTQYSPDFTGCHPMNSTWCDK